MFKFNPSRTSVFGKIAFLLAFSTAVVGIALTFMAWKVTSDLAIDNLHAFADGASNDLAQKSARAIRFNDAAEIERLAVDLFELSADRVESIVVLGADGGTRYASASDAPYHAAFVEFAKATDEPRYQDLDRSRFMKAVPALMGAEGTQVGVIGIVWSAEAVLAQVTDRKFGSIGLALVLFLAMMALAAFMVRRSITEPLKSIGESLQDIVAGRYDTEIGGRERQDELGVFARNIVDLQKRLQESRAVQSARDEEQAEQQRVVSELRSGLRALSQQDLTQSLIDSFSEEYEPLRSDYNQGIEGLRQIVSAVIENSEAVRLSAEEISSSSDNLARRTETQAATLEETSATLTEITKSVSEAANNAREVEGIVLGAQAQTEQSDEIVQEAVGAMEEIENSSQKIASIISVIDDIAFQTNLLALNAGVEAARAGEAGKGFAVVATEVRSLAQRSADAAKEIKELITGSTQQVDRGVELVRRAGGALSEISNQVTHISELVSGIATSAGEQAHGISEINSGVTQLELVTQENAAMVEQSTAAGHLLREQSVELADLIGQFTINRGRHPHEAQRMAAE